MEGATDGSMVLNQVSLNPERDRKKTNLCTNCGSDLLPDLVSVGHADTVPWPAVEVELND
jgi:hypothetical protein